MFSKVRARSEALRFLFVHSSVPVESVSNTGTSKGEGGWSFGRFFNQRSVRLVKPCPYWVGSIVCVGFPMCVDSTPLGFSKQIFGIGAFHNAFANAIAEGWFSRKYS